MSEKSFAAQLAQKFANIAPVCLDPEDDIENETLAKVTAGAVDDVDTEKSHSALRNRNSLLLADEDAKYAGVTVSRRSLLSGDDLSDSDNLSAGSEDGGSDDETRSSPESQDLDYEFVDQTTGNSKRKQKGKADDAGDEGEDADEDASDDGDEEDSYYDQFDMDLSAFAKGTRLADSSADGSYLEDGDSEVESEASEGGVTTLNKGKADEEVKRGQAVQNQIKMWEALLELRIELQKLLNAANQLPQHDLWGQLCDDKEANENSQRLSPQQLDEVEVSCLGLTSELMTLQTVLERGSPPPSTTGGVKRTFEEMESSIGVQFKASQIKRNDVIQKWDDKTRMSVAVSSKRKGVDHTQQSTLKQIEHILIDKNRLLSRTRQRRNNIHVIGKPFEEKPEINKEADHSCDPATDRKSSAQHHTIDDEIFNDDDFYHQLLRELIDQKTSKSDDPVAMSRQWLEFQALRKKIKRTIDTRASKGRKLRYNVMPKLVNFMAPIISAEDWDDDRKDELFASLFDKKPEYKVIDRAEPSDVVILA